VLEELWIRTPLHSTTDHTWLYKVLSRISSKRLRQLFILFDIRHLFDETAQAKLWDLAESPDYTWVDNLLSTKQYSCLTHVVFVAWATADGVMPDRQEWMERLSVKFPRMCARGIFQTSVWVADMDRT